MYACMQHTHTHTHTHTHKRTHARTHARSLALLSPSLSHKHTQVTIKQEDTVARLLAWCRAVSQHLQIDLTSLEADTTHRKEGGKSWEEKQEEEEEMDEEEKHTRDVELLRKMLDLLSRDMDKALRAGLAACTASCLLLSPVASVCVSGVLVVC